MALAAPTMDFSGSPNAGVYAQQALAAQQAYNTALTNIAARKSQLYNTAGFKADGSVDGTNLTGQYQQLQRAQGMGLEAQHNLDKSRGIGGAGIAEQGTSNLRFGDQVQQANFGNAFQGSNQALADAGTSAFNGYQNALMQLQLQSIADARSTQNFPGAPTSGGGTAPGAKAPANNAGWASGAKASIGGSIAKNNGWGGVLGLATPTKTSTKKTTASTSLASLIAKGLGW